ncbi:MAG: Crp/Fnr family transcriptional regulator [Gammaproteobacteria bacterium]|nr:Crp/Fnr family transcriptional regulator [Gammaproteobacteria bacterium]
MSQANAKIVAQDSADVQDHVVDKITTNASGKQVVISKVAQLLFQYGKKKPFNKGEFIIREGHNDKTVYILLSGEVEILKKDQNDKDQVVTKISEAGTIVGEMSTFLDEPRTTSVRISEDSMILVFTGQSFITAVVNIPELSMRILKSLSNKLKSTNERVIQNTVCAACSKNL